MTYTQRSDEDCALLAQAGDNRAAEHLLSKWRRIAAYKSRTYFSPGTDQEDMIQEGLFGLTKAIRDFTPGHGCSFRTFADLCINRQMISAVKTLRGSLRPIPVGRVAGYSERDEEGDQLVRGHAVKALLDQVRTPEQLTFGRGMAQATLARVQGLCSKFEWECLQRFAAEQSYDEIAEHVKPGRNGSGPKSVDNALTRVRRKLKKLRP